MTEGLRERIRLAAEANGRSMNSEIVAILEEAYPPDRTLQELQALILEIVERVDETEGAGQLWKARLELERLLAALGEKQDAAIREGRYPPEAPEE